MRLPNRSWRLFRAVLAKKHCWGQSREKSFPCSIQNKIDSASRVRRHYCRNFLFPSGLSPAGGGGGVLRPSQGRFLSTLRCASYFAAYCCPPNRPCSPCSCFCVSSSCPRVAWETPDHRQDGGECWLERRCGRLALLRCRLPINRRAAEQHGGAGFSSMPYKTSLRRVFPSWCRVSSCGRPRTLDAHRSERLRSRLPRSPSNQYHREWKCWCFATSHKPGNRRYATCCVGVAAAAYTVVPEPTHLAPRRTTRTAAEKASDWLLVVTSVPSFGQQHPRHGLSQNMSRSRSNTEQHPAPPPSSSRRANLRVGTLFVSVFSVYLALVRPYVTSN